MFDRDVLTPNDRFFVRWHCGDIPTAVDVATFRLTIFGHVARPLAIPLGELLKLPRVELVAARCGACHSPGMPTTQPVLKPEQWAATVKKMREVYKAPIAEREVPAILAYLNALSAARLPAAAATTTAPAP